MERQHALQAGVLYGVCATFPKSNPRFSVAFNVQRKFDEISVYYFNYIVTACRVSYLHALSPPYLTTIHHGRECNRGVQVQRQRHITAHVKVLELAM